VLFGESHLAPGHLRACCASKCLPPKILTVLQNVDALYWRAAGERADKVEAVRVQDDVLCVFNATPLEKYESYRLFLDQWAAATVVPTTRRRFTTWSIALASFLEINRYSPHNARNRISGHMLPEVHGKSSDAMGAPPAFRRKPSAGSVESMLASVEERGSAYFPELNAFCIREFQLVHAAEDAAGFLHHACRVCRIG